MIRQGFFFFVHTSTLLRTAINQERERDGEDKMRSVAV